MCVLEPHFILPLISMGVDHTSEQCVQQQEGRVWLYRAPDIGDDINSSNNTQDPMYECVYVAAPCWELHDPEELCVGTFLGCVQVAFIQVLYCVSPSTAHIYTRMQVRCVAALVLQRHWCFVWQQNCSSTQRGCLCSGLVCGCFLLG